MTTLSKWYDKGQLLSYKAFSIQVGFRACGAKDRERLISFICTGTIATAKLNAILNGIL